MRLFGNLDIDNIDDLIRNLEQDNNNCVLGDTLGGFDHGKNNKVLEYLDQYAKNIGKKFVINYAPGFLDNSIKNKYPSLDIRWTFAMQNQRIWEPFLTYNIHPVVNHQSFLCSFNGTAHVGRKLLVAILQRCRYFDPKTCSKNFKFTVDILDGHLNNYLDPYQHRFHRPFFISADSERFFDQIYSFGHVRFNHAQNIYNLEHQLTRSFLHVVSECMATSYYPYVSEKFLYSVITRGLFLTYAQPGWHDYLERYYGFQKYNRIFDYRFDIIQNPVERLTELMTMIAKFSVLGTDDWRDLYELERDTIEYNYDHYFSRNYLKHLENYTYNSY